MPAIETAVALIWGAFLALIGLVLFYFGFVVAGRQDASDDREADRAVEEPATSTMGNASSAGDA